MKRRSHRSLRLAEIVLWVLGISLLGAASGETLDRWQYQEQQEQALFGRAPVPLPQPPDATPAGPRAAEPAAEVEVAEQTPVAERPIVERVKPRRSAAPDPSVLGRLEIPRLGISAIVGKGDDNRTLSRAIGWLPGSARPGEVGNAVLAAHRDTFFRRLEEIETNDRIRLVVPPETYEYRVSSVRVVDPEETSVLASRGVEEITLVTCYPFRYVGPAPDRFIVAAERVR